MSFDSFGADREGLQNQGLLCVGFRFVVMVGTLPKTNIAPENRPAMLVSGRVIRDPFWIAFDWHWIGGTFGQHFPRQIWVGIDKYGGVL